MLVVGDHGVRGHRAAVLASVEFAIVIDFVTLLRRDTVLNFVKYDSFFLIQLRSLICIHNNFVYFREKPSRRNPVVVLNGSIYEIHGIWLIGNVTMVLN